MDFGDSTLSQGAHPTYSVDISASATHLQAMGLLLCWYPGPRIFPLNVHSFCVASIEFATEVSLS
jgi:hypothetical protein